MFVSDRVISVENGGRFLPELRQAGCPKNARRLRKMAANLGFFRKMPGSHFSDDIQLSGRISEEQHGSGTCRVIVR